MIKIIHIFYGTRMFMTVLTGVRHLCLSLAEYIPRCITLRYVLILSSDMHNVSGKSYRVIL
jgi:hypothetical protein